MKKAGTTALVVATRAAVDRCGPGHVSAPLLTRTEEGQGQRGGERVVLHGPAACDSAAMRRRQRRPRSWLRHDRMTDALALAEKLHHSAQRPKMAPSMIRDPPPLRSPAGALQSVR